MLDMWNMTQISTFLLFVNVLRFYQKGKKNFYSKWLDHLLLITSHLVTTVTDSHQTCVKMCLRDAHAATESGRG